MGSIGSEVIELSSVLQKLLVSSCLIDRVKACDCIRVPAKPIALSLLAGLASAITYGSAKSDR